MRKFLLGLVCCLVVVGVANMGHAFWIFGGGGGGGKGGKGASPNQVEGAHFDFDFMRNLPKAQPKAAMARFLANSILIRTATDGTEEVN